MPQGSILGSILYVFYTADIPTTQNAMVAMYTDDTAILSRHKDYRVASTLLQNAVSKVTKWAKRWKIKLNELKSIRVDFALRPHGYEPTYIANKPVPSSNTARYLGIHLDSRLTWPTHVSKKKEYVRVLLRKYYWLLGYHSTLGLGSKQLVYNMIIKPSWTYGIQIWGTTKKSNREVVQRAQNKVLRCITQAPWFVPNVAIHRDLRMDTVEETIRKAAEKYSRRLHSHPNVEAIQLLDD